MADIRLAISALAIYEQLAAAAIPYLIAAYRPFGIELHVEKGIQLQADPITSDGWQQLILYLTQSSSATTPPAPAHVIFATVPPGLDRSINGQLLNEARGLCALFLGANSFQTPSPYKRLDLVAQVLIHEVGHLLNLTHGDSYGFGHSDAMMPSLDRQQQAPLPAWQAASADAISRHEPPLQIPSLTYYYPFGAQCRACLRAAATDPGWWPWRSKFRDEFSDGAGTQSDFSIDTSIDQASLPEIITTGDGISFTLHIRNNGEQPIPIPMHIGPEFGTMSVATEAQGKSPVLFKPDNYRCSSGKIAVLPGETIHRSFSLIPTPEESLFSEAGPHSIQVKLFTSELGSRLLVGMAVASVRVVRPTETTSAANRVAAQLVATIRGHHTLPTRGDFDKLQSLLEDSTIAHHARYKLAMLHSGDQRVRLLKECLKPETPTAVRHRAARQLAIHLLQSGWKLSKVMSSMRRYRLDERDEELFETLERMEHTPRMKYLLATCIGVTLLSLSGCTSLEGSKYNYGEKDENNKLKGVPFTLNKPVPTIVHVSATDDKRETYTTTFAYTADSKHRYTLTVNPSYLASVDFSLSFDALGSFTEGSVKTTDQSAAILTSVGKLALTMLDASERAVDINVARLIEKGDAMKLTGEDEANWKSVKADLRRLQIDKKVKAEYVYRLPGERAVLRKIYEKAMKDLAMRAEEYRPPAVDTTVTAPKEPVSAPIPVPVQLKGSGSSRTITAIETDEKEDVKSFRAMVDEVMKSNDKPFAGAVVQAMNSGNVAALNGARSAEVTALQGQRASLELRGTPTVLKESNATIARISLLTGATNAIPEYLRMAQGMAEISPTDWKRRTVAALNTDIDARAHTVRIQLANSSKPLPSLGALECPIVSNEAVVAPLRDVTAAKTRTAASAVAPQPFVIEDLAALCLLKQKKAIVLGVSNEYRRRADLASKLATAGTPKELKLLRDEIASLDTTIADAESSLKAKAKETKTEEPYVAFYKNITSETDENGPSVLTFVGNKRPKYVVLVRNLDVNPPSSPGPASSPSDQTGKGSASGERPKTGDLSTPVTPAVPPVGGAK